ncbi:MAG: hypothetical protein K0S88_1290, partial [Actinomycetia bacterium]|nr:hypothetical protein [Actinomycetes bacterium]
MGTRSAGSRTTWAVGLLGPLRVSVAGRPVARPAGRLSA